MVVPLLAAWVVLGPDILAAVEPDGADRVVEAAKTQDWPGLEALLGAGADPDARHGDGATALHWAVYWDHVDAAARLVDAGADVGVANDLGVTPLWLACNNASTAMVDTLLSAGADPNAALPAGETPLMTASRTGSVAVVTSLLASGAAVKVSIVSKLWVPSGINFS